MKRRRNNSISGQFSARLIEMLASPAYRVLSRAAHMVLARIEVEHGNHGGNDNGRLPVTFDDFEEYGVERHAIAPALREVEALGFAYVTQRGNPGQANRRRPNYFRLTYRPLPTDRKGDGTHEWRRIQTIDEARVVAKLARKKTESLVRISPVGSGETPLKHTKTRGKPPLPKRGKTPTTIYISGEDTGQSGCEARPLQGAVASSPTTTERPEVVQARIARRLGPTGWEILQAVSDEDLRQAAALEERGALDDQMLEMMRLHARRGAA